MANTLKITDEFNIDSKWLYEQFIDLRKYGKYHPVMTNVKVVLDKTPEFIEYEIDEEVMLFGFIKIHPNYKAKVFEIEKEKHLQYTSQVKSTIFLTIDIYFSENSGKTNVEEQISVTGNKIITTIFLGILKKAHLGLFQSLKANIQKV
jgi:hypothetical protein